MSLIQPGLTKEFDPPAYLEDLTPANRKGWSRLIAGFCDAAREGNEEDPNDHPRPQFFNSMKQPIARDFQTKDISWQAFPRYVSLNNPNDLDRWPEADSSRDLQDEYCEWSVERNREGNITRVTFTSEPPEYWEFLAKTQPDTLLQLYQKHISPAVKKADLFDARGRYIRRNRWNRDTATGAMHLTQDNNTLSAEVELAGAASIVRKIDGEVLTNASDLIGCGQYGAPERFSDPHIGASVNELARTGADVTIANPVALYIDSFTPASFITPDGTDANEFWRFTRGNKGLYVRGVFEVPKAKGYVVGDIEIEGKGTIQWGSQLADYIRIKLVGLACNFDKQPQPVERCVGQSAANPSDKANAAALSAVGLEQLLEDGAGAKLRTSRTLKQ